MLIADLTDEQAAVRMGFSLSEAEISCAFQEALAKRGEGDGRLNFDPERVQDDLAKLVLTLMEFLRRLMELQAIRRMESGTLTAEQEDQLGETLMLARDQIIKMAQEFGLNERDLNLDLGPFGRLL